VRLALDTNAYTDLAQDVPRIVSLVTSAATVDIPFVVLAELRAGFSVGSRRADNERVLSSFLSKPGIQVLYPDENTVSAYAVLYQHLRRAGKMIPTNDLWIAALCVQHGLTLCSRDAHFDHLPQIPRI
jgi:predicted nucleic acid-binding protein